MRDPGAILLISCYELGHQPLGLAAPAAALERAGFRPSLLDLSLEPLTPEQVGCARLVGISVPMHTALRLGVHVGRRVRAINPGCHLVYYGLYAPLNADYLLGEGGADRVIGGEYEAPLVALAEELASNGSGRAAHAAPVTSHRHPAPIEFALPSRGSLPDLRRYAHLERDGRHLPAGCIEASRGCLHACRHCPLPPVYAGRFFVVPAAIVLADIEQLHADGARHVTFGDADFLNGPSHVLRIVREMHRRFPGMTFDITTKVSNIVRHRALVAELGALGCVFIVSAFESLSDRVLAILAKGHTRADIRAALAITRAAGIPLRPTFVAFTPWTTSADYLELIDFVDGEGLVHQVDPVQYALRLLVPPGSLLLDRPELAPYLGELDRAALTYQWTHPDPRLDVLAVELAALVGRATGRRDDPQATFGMVKTTAEEHLLGCVRAAPAVPPGPARLRPPRLTEDWFC